MMDGKEHETKIFFKCTFVIIGGGIAGVSCVEQLAIEEPDSTVILVSSSPVVKAVRNINKISERLESFDIKEEPHDIFRKRNPKCQVFDDKVVDIDNTNHIVFLSKGGKIKYEKLCICTGARPKVIAEPSPYILGIRDTETVQTFQEKLSNAKRILIVGNGGIATELVYEIENCETIWVIKDKSVGATFFDAGAAQFFLPCLSEKKKIEISMPDKRMKYRVNDVSLSTSTMGSALGPDWSTEISMKGNYKRRLVRVEYENEVKQIYERSEFHKKRLISNPVDGNLEWPVYAELTNGHVYGCDFIISATGVLPNSDFCTNEKFLLGDDGGICVDDQMKTNFPDVFAAGDVCTASWNKSAHWFQMRLWTQARQMGAYAAKCMANDRRQELTLMDICFDLFTHVTQFFGYKVILLGLFNGQGLGQDQEIVVRVSERTEYCKVILQGGKMQGAVLVGETDLEETFENLILNQLDISSLGEDILSPVVDIEDYFD